MQTSRKAHTHTHTHTHHGSRFCFSMLAAQTMQNIKISCIFRRKTSGTLTSVHNARYRTRRSTTCAMQRMPVEAGTIFLLYWWISQSLGKTCPRATSGFRPHAAQYGATASLFARGTPTRPNRHVCTERGSTNAFCAKKGYPPSSGTTNFFKGQRGNEPTTCEHLKKMNQAPNH